MEHASHVQNIKDTNIIQKNVDQMHAHRDKFFLEMDYVKPALIIKEFQMMERHVLHRSVLRLINFKLMEVVPLNVSGR